MKPRVDLRNNLPIWQPSRRLLGGLAVFALTLATGGYAWFGGPAALRGAPQAFSADASARQTTEATQIPAMVAKLEDRLKTQPDDAQGWSMLGRSYGVLGRHADAAAAYQRASGLRPNDAQAMADRADAMSMAAGRRLGGEPEKLIARALQLDPRNLKALALAGTVAFDRADYAGAVRHWENAVASGEPGSALVRNLQAGVGEARARGGLPPSAAVTASSAVTATLPSASPRASAPATPGGGGVTGRVVLAPSLKPRAAAGDTVFVFARAVDGPRLPLAILRKQVKDLPFDFVLDDSLAMNPAMRMSSATEVVVAVHLSKSGNATAQPGDLQGVSPPVRVGTRALQIEIGQVVK